MADIEMTEYKFPDEVDKSAKKVEEPEPLEIVIQDDTPEEDRRNATPLPKDIADEVEQDELEDYSAKAKERLQQMKKIYNDERRAKEAAEKEKAEALRFAQSIVEENKKLKGKLSAGEQTLHDTAKENISYELEQAKKAFKDAYDSGDADRLAEAQEKLTEVKIKAKEVERFKPEFAQDTLQTEETPVQMQQPVPQRLDAKTQAWMDQNPWYGVDEDMSFLAMGIHRRLERAGVPIASDEYFNLIDTEMRQRFPEKFGIEETKNSSKAEAKPSGKTSRLSSVVAPATRSTSPKRVTLTPTQIALARKFNLTPEQYARELTKLESQNG